jgi:4,5-DOPA dioxygenase extradiol
MDMHAARDAAVPAWAREFDAWLAETVTRSDVDALLDYRARAPAVELAHPDDGDHFDVLLVALGAALGQGSALAHVASAVNGFEAGSMSKRCFTLG